MSIKDKAMLCRLELRAWTGEKADRNLGDEVADTHGAAHDALSTTLRLVPRVYIKPIVSLDTATRKAHATYTLPWMDDGTRILTSSLFIEYTQVIREFLDRRDVLVEEFARNLPAMKEHAAKQLGALYKEGDFPSQEEIVGRFRSAIRFTPIPDGNDFRVDLSEGVAEEIRRTIESDVKGQIDQSVAALRERISDTITTFVDRIKDYKIVPDGSRKGGFRTEGSFRDTVVEGVKDLARLLPGLNLTEDPAIFDLTKEIQSKLAGLSAPTLRDQESARTQAVEAAKGIIAKFGL